MPEIDVRHRDRQLAVRARTVRDLILLWRNVDPEDFFDTYQSLTPAVQLLIDRDRRLSSGIASAYYRELRAAEQVASAMPAVSLAGPVDVQQLGTSLKVTGPVAYVKAVRAGATSFEAARRSLIATSGASSRHVLNAGRDTLMSAMVADPEPVRWRRIAAATACQFCTMLASRGAVYRPETAGFQAHDHCACMPAPAF